MLRYCVRFIRKILGKGVYELLLPLLLFFASEKYKIDQKEKGKSQIELIKYIKKVN
jgi:hypothetical protein